MVLACTKGEFKMQSTHRNGIRFFTIILTAIFMIASFHITYAAPNIPQNIKIGLSYNNAANDNFVIKSDGGMKISVNSGTSYTELLSYTGASGLKIRKDSYYNIINYKETEINYVKATQYAGELIGPYHIQIGDVYADFNSAKVVADSMAPFSQTVFVAYDKGWRVWAQLYLTEEECLAKIQLFKNEMPSNNYSVVAPNKMRVQIFDAATGKLLYIVNAETDIKLEPLTTDSAVPIMFFGTLKYRGTLFLKRIAEGHINVYNELPFEEYLYGVVPAEVPSSWHMEALKAQAVAARNYGILNIGRHTANGFDLCNGQHCQAYRGFSHENTKTNQAVDETKGKLVYYNDKLINTYFHSSSGGRTENSENVWTDALPYIRSVDDQYSLGSPHDNWTKQYSKNDIKTKLTANKIDIGEIIDVVPLKYSSNGRVTLLEIRGTKGFTQLAKERIRSIMGSSDIRSIWYNISTDADLYVKDSSDLKPQKERASGLYVMSANGVQKLNNSSNKLTIKSQNTTANVKMIPENYTFSGKGWGHGLGMSQYGAKGMAEQGFNYIQILEYYYTGAKVK
jgi:stage II sporulation protein D